MMDEVPSPRFRMWVGRDKQHDKNHVLVLLKSYSL